MADAADNENRHAERTTHLIRIFRPRREMMTFLDLGCGTGTITKQIQEHYKIPEAYGVDLHPPTQADIEEAAALAAAAEAERREIDAEEEAEILRCEQETAKLPAAPAPPPPMCIDFDDGPAAPPPPAPAKPVPKPRRKSLVRTYEYKQLVDDVIPLPDNSMDFITCFMVLHHFEHFNAMITELKRVLKPQGFLFIREHDVRRNDTLLKKSLDNMHANFSDHMTSGVINYWPRDELKTVLTEEFDMKHVLDDDYPPNVANPQAIYHSLYAKAAVTDLKYVPPSERMTKASPTTPGSGTKGLAGKGRAGSWGASNSGNSSTGGGPHNGHGKGKKGAPKDKWSWRD